MHTQILQALPAKNEPSLDFIYISIPCTNGKGNKISMFRF